MSKYEMLDYDRLLERIGITPGETWFCGDNPPEEWHYEQEGFTYDDVRAGYSGRNQGHGALCLGEDINVNGLLLNHRDVNGTIWLCTDIEGWWTLPPSEIPEVPKPFWDGNLLTTGRYLARNITVSGCFIPPDPKLVWYNRDALIRVSSIVRGIGLIALCGNESPFIVEDSPFFDPPKMAIIQMSDVPLIETTKPNGFTQFSLQFKCVQPAKLSIREQSASIPVEAAGITRKRRYKAFSETTAELPGKETTQYVDLMEVQGDPVDRTYKGVRELNFSSIIDGEEYPVLDYPSRSVPPYNTMTDAQYEVVKATIVSEYYEQTTAARTTVLHNAGNYFAFPVFVLNPMTHVSKDQVVTLRNWTTGEAMQIQKEVPTGSQLVIDTGMRRVAIVDPLDSPSEWIWDERSAITLTSQWISLAPGDNTVIASMSAKPSGGTDTSIPISPTVLWRDTWIG